MKKQLTLLLFALCALFFAGCSTPPMEVYYIPTSQLTAEGTVHVGSFTYSSAQANGVEANQVQNTAVGNIYTHKSINDIFGDAVSREFRKIGITLKDDANVELSGDIKKLLRDDLGFSADWTLEVHYVVKSRSDGSVLYEVTKTVEQKTSKFGDFIEHMTTLMRMNIDRLVMDPDFIKAIK